MRFLIRYYGRIKRLAITRQTREHGKSKKMEGSGFCLLEGRRVSRPMIAGHEGWRNRQRSPVGNSSISVHAPPATRRSHRQIAPACTSTPLERAHRRKVCTGIRRRTAAPGDLWLVRPIMQSSGKPRETERSRGSTQTPFKWIFAFPCVQVLWDINTSF